MGFPVEVTTIHNATAYIGSVTIHIFRRRMRNNISSPFKRTAIDRCCKCIIHHKRHTMLMGNASKLFDIKNFHSRIRQGFSEHQFCIRTESFADLFFTGIFVDECTIDPHFLQGNTQQIIGSSINTGCTDNMISRFTNIEAGKEISRLS